MSKKLISVVIPCRNQDDKIDDTIEDIKKTAKGIADYDVEIVFVNDRSTDKSVEIAKKHLTDYKNSQLLHTDESYIGNGKGLAVELGMTKATGDYRLFMDADNSTKFEEIAKFIPYFDKYDIVLGTRYSKEVVIPTGNWFKSFWFAVVDVIQVLIYGHAKRYTATTKQGRLRELVSRGGNLAFTVLLGQSFTDSRCGFKMYSKEASEKIFPLCRIKTWDFDSEALVLAKKFGYSMVEVPVVWYDDAGASNFKPKDMINAFKAIFLIRFYQLLGKYGRSKGGKGPLITVVILFVISALLGAFYYSSCKISPEVRAYVSGKSNSYVFSKPFCQNNKGFNMVKEDSLDKLPKTGRFEIIVDTESEESEVKQKLTEAYLAVNELTVSSEKEQFKVYEVICATCGQN